MPVPSDVPNWARRLILLGRVPEKSGPKWNKLRQNFRQRLIVLGSTRRYHAFFLGLGVGVAGLLRGRRGSVDHIKSTLALGSSSTKVTGRPMNITIEPTNACNLGC